MRSVRVACLAFVASVVAMPIVTSHAEPHQKPAAAAPHSTPTAKRLALASELFELMNGPDTIASWKRMLGEHKDFSQCGCAGNKEMISKLQRGWQVAVADELDAGEMRADLERMLAAALNERELAILIRFRKTPLGRAIQTAEIRHGQMRKEESPAAGMARLVSAQRELNKSPARRQVIERILAAQGGVDSLVDIMMSLPLGTAIGTMAATPDNQPRMTHDELTAQLEAMRAPMARQMGPLLVPAYGELYNALSTKELSAFLKELTTPLNKKASGVYTKAFGTSLRIQAIKIGERMGRELQAQSL